MKISVKCRLAPFVLAAALLASVQLSFPDSVQATNWNDILEGWERYSNLPEEVNQLHESYQQTQEQLQQAQENLKSYQEQNAQLLEQNRKLTETVTELTRQQQRRAAALHRNKIIFWTSLGLLIGYFVLIRLMRYLMKRRSDRL
ncbi:hypothetical protein OIN60_19960 [Paenibacillus sp. P96]|uniref:Uncharacterized protein n=1 Tax=Paenibacillus zeirhizosphaerae TaxID=2987519 RepID=A0ABT9FW96_9BACL|nr:hypothetical protein [Paenibacillus sp. P96]MDP4099004.1 hypothetical protein [Paenibacillus sp. P96]